ncbi:MAG: hypothetical protein ACOYXT_24690 [Bacteroidota bacterium]
MMFLGWVFNALFIAYVTQFTEGKQNFFKSIFWILQVLVAGILICFPLQGYGLFSIIFSTLHTLTVYAFIVLFFNRTQGRTELSVWLARTSLIFFIISSAGPFFLGYLKANHLDHLNLYRNSIYFYLHFQYNGFFFIGILSLFVSLIEKVIDSTQLTLIKVSGWLFVASAFPAYFLSVLWTNPGTIFNLIGAFACFVQMAAMIMLLKAAREFINGKPRYFKPEFARVLCFIAAALILKICFQSMSAYQEMSALIHEHRTIVIGYLHLVLLGMISLSLIGWLIQAGVISRRFGYWGNRLLITGFVASEILLFIFPWHNSFLVLNPINFQLTLFCFSCLMAGGVALYLIGSFQWKKE